MGVPALALPGNGAVGQALSLTMSWGTVAGATSYDLQVSADAGFGSTVSDQNVLTAASGAIGGLGNNTVYYWRVDATKSGEGTGAWSSVNSFTTIIGAPTLASPSNNAAGQATTLNLTWNSLAGATSYGVQVSAATDFSSTIFYGNNISGTSATIAGLANNGVYYWRVNATESGATGAWSTAYSFTTIVGVPALALPGNGAVGQATTLTMSWGTVSGATSYDLQVSADAGFGSTVSDQNALTAATGAVSGLGNNTVYYWRVNATKSGEGTGAWSSVNSFTTIVGVPALALPANGAVNQPLSLTMSWGTVSGAATYALRVSTGSTFANIVFSQGGITASSIGIAGITYSMQYYWQVNAANGAGTSAWSNVWNFTTAPPKPGKVTLSSPSNNVVNQAQTLTLSWQGAFGAVSYTLQVSTGTDFSTFAFNQSSLTGTSQSVGPLADSVEFYWRVNATNAGGTGSWSDVWNFTTIPNVPAQVALSSPASGTQNTSLTPTLGWSVTPKAGSFTLQVSTGSDFSSTVTSMSGLPGLVEQVGPLADSVEYVGA